MKSEKIRNIIINVFWFLLLAFISYRMPLYVDDVLHSKSFATGEVINRIGMIPASVGVYYETWGGRAVSMFLIQLMLMLPDIIYACVNAAVWVLLVNAEYAYGRVAVYGKVWGNTGYNGLTVSILYVMNWFFMPDFMEVVTWTTGSITYLWMNTVIVIFGLLYYSDYLNGTGNAGENGTVNGTSRSPLYIAGGVITYLLLGLCAGLSDEAGACTLIFALLLYTAGMIISKRKIHIEKWAGIISCLAGFAILMLSPGNRIRIAASRESSGEGASFVMTYVHRIGRETFYTLMFMTIPFAIWLALYLISEKKKINVKHVIGDVLSGGPCIFILFAFAGIYVMTFPSGFANRIYQFPLIMICIGTAMVLERIQAAYGGMAIFVSIKGALCVFMFILMLAALCEVVAGSLFGTQAGSFFDRQMMYYHIDDHSVDGLLPGNGIQ